MCMQSIQNGKCFAYRNTSSNTQHTEFVLVRNCNLYRYSPENFSANRSGPRCGNDPGLNDRYARKGRKGFLVRDVGAIFRALPARLSVGSYRVCRLSRGSVSRYPFCRFSFDRRNSCQLGGPHTPCMPFSFTPVSLRVGLTRRILHPRRWPGTLQRIDARSA